MIEPENRPRRPLLIALLVVGTLTIVVAICWNSIVGQYPMHP